ncbi:hypothetical protein CONCODRAFT_12161 [Conidiobolus coronatus NRRL 28638]|uniref:Uncharacterized protein n=1 Tax=Conidiobolus coronatus (strain ATCC 28846 / CBS 209.66 / NRRL 28638) TaxID=796925 RepID=A0A137NTJ8_CONC2|nr:hypothetical protein CONCODRAFT_12161 [Conidiobolus coronatus NRRL 28638]|eukprot:KXN66080.1 hypothetical protein CONCODRAFT_12161 [Conidiobolus coronatus NRRL 28638]
MLVFKTSFICALVAGFVIEDIVYHCGQGLEGPMECPPGYRCCGPISVEFGGTCYNGEPGICPVYAGSACLSLKRNKLIG